MAKKTSNGKGKWIIIALILVAAAVAAVLNFATADEKPAVSTDPTDYVEINIENYGTITAELYGGIAPITVENFLKLADEGF